MGSGHWRRGHWLTPCPPYWSVAMSLEEAHRMPPATIFSGLLRLKADDNGGMTLSLPSSIYIIMAKCLFNHPPFSLVTSVSFLLKTYLYETKAAAFRYLSTRLGLLLYSAKPSQGRALGLDISTEKSSLETSSSNISLCPQPPVLLALSLLSSPSLIWPLVQRWHIPGV